MKQITIFVLSILILASCTETKKDVQITGKIENAKTNKLEIIIDNTEHDTILLGEEGVYTYISSREKSVYGLIRLGGAYIKIYIEPGKNFIMNFDLENQLETLTFEGEGALTNNYLLGIAKLEKDDMMKMRQLVVEEPANFIRLTDSTYQIKVKFLETELNKAKVSEDFKHIEREKLRYALANFRELYPRYHTMYTAKVPDLDDAFYAYRNELSLDDVSLINVQEYQSYLYSALIVKVNKVFEENSELNKNSENDYYGTKFDKVSETFTNPEIRDYMLNQAISPILKYVNLELVPEYINKFNEQCTNVEFKEKVASDFAEWESLMKGKPAFDFTYESIDGKMISLSDFKGKYVYIDVWATWCGPCKKEIPVLKELEKEFNEKNIVFMSVSIDKLSDKEKWRAMLKENEMAGIQLIADKDKNSSISVDYKIKGIPRFLLIDRDGSIIDVRAPRPSSGEVEEILLGLEGL
jgi:thiol-disulfide isomerase/thioredoxin